MAFRHIVNLGNSIVGVSLLSMPFCFKTAGIFLSILTIIVSSFINRFACHLILKSARLSKRRNFENLSFGVFGITGKLIAEIAILGFLMGTCVGFFVVIGDLCPSLITQLFDIPNYTHLRTFTMMFLGMFIALPLALKRRVDESFSTISMCLYLLLTMNLFAEAFTKLTLDNDKLFSKLNWWNFENYFRVLPIFITCLSCQPQLFEIFEHSIIFSEDKNALARINETIKQAIFMCSLLYISVGIFGYFAFLENPSIEGNLLVDLPPSLFSILAKLGFLFTIILSLPICLFPCRTSLHSLLYGKPTSSLLNEMTLIDSYIPDDRWLFLTVLLIVLTICISIILPHIEFILGLIGSTTGALVCLIFPALFFINLTFKKNNERLCSFFVLFFGISLFIFSTITLISVDPQELTSEGQMVKNLNLSTNRIEKLIEQNKLDQNKIENDIKKSFNELNDKLRDNKFNELKGDQLELKNKELKNLSEKEFKNDELNKTKGDLSNDSSIKIDLKENRLQSNKEKSGFINAVEMKKKILSREKLNENLIRQDDSSKLKSSSIGQTELKLNKAVLRNLTSNKLANEKKAIDPNKKILVKNETMKTN